MVGRPFNTTGGTMSLSTEDAGFLNHTEEVAARCTCGNHEAMNKAGREMADVLRADLDDISDVDIARVLIAVNRLMVHHLPVPVLQLQHTAAAELTKLERHPEEAL
jgi:hypothetical protein